MILKEDCADFGYSKNDITEFGVEQRRFIDIPNCRKHKMSLCGCSETCPYYSSNVSGVSE
ncbi:MAG TPA: hypothetical protein VIO11_08480 [Candidatus Methanoperedens sp.]